MAEEQLAAALAEVNKWTKLCDEAIKQRDQALEGVEKARARAFAERRDWLEILGPELRARRNEQDLQWGGPADDDKYHRSDWLQFIFESWGRRWTIRYGRVQRSPEEFENAMLHIAALAIAAIQSSRRKRGVTECTMA